MAEGRNTRNKPAVLVALCNYPVELLECTTHILIEAWKALGTRPDDLPTANAFQHARSVVTDLFLKVLQR